MLDALPGQASLAWWGNFWARQIVTFEMARTLKFLLLDCIILGTWTGAATVLGPLVTLLCLQAKGWPFIVAVWGFLDCILIQGDNAFQNHWLHWTGWQIYSMQAQSGLHIIASQEYLRVLLCMMVAGVLTALKRTALAISFGRRQYSTFKPRLEKLLLDVVVLNEIASLSAHVESLQVELNIGGGTSKSSSPRKKDKRVALGDVSWNSVKNVEQEEEEDVPLQSGSGHAPTIDRQSSSLSSFSLKALLEHWDAPVGNQDTVRARQKSRK